MTTYSNKKQDPEDFDVEEIDITLRPEDGEEDGYPYVIARLKIKTSMSNIRNKGKLLYELERMFKKEKKEKSIGSHYPVEPREDLLQLCSFGQCPYLSLQNHWDNMTHILDECLYEAFQREANSHVVDWDREYEIIIPPIHSSLCA